MASVDGGNTCLRGRDQRGFQPSNGRLANLFVAPDDLTSASWLKLGDAQVGGNAIANPTTGAIDADALTSLSSGAGWVQQNLTITPVVGDVYEGEVWLKSRVLPCVILGADTDYINLAYTAGAMAIGTGAFVIALWWYCTDTTAGNRVIFQSASTAQANGVSIWQNGTELDVYVQSGGNIPSVGVLTANKWHRIVIVCSAAGATSCYVNGAAANGGSFGAHNITSTDAWRLGRSVDQATSARGFYSDLVFCSDSVGGFVAPTATDVLNEFKGTFTFTGIKGRWPLNEGTGTTVSGSVGGGSGTLNGSASWGSGLNATLEIADGADGVPTTSAVVGVTGSWQRFTVAQTLTAASSSTLSFLDLASQPLYQWGARLYKVDNPASPSGPQPSVSASTGPDAGEYGVTDLLVSNGVTLESVLTTSYFFKMIGQDHTTSAVDTWVVRNTPDLTGAFYTGSLTTPLRNIAIAAAWTVSS